MRLTSKSLLYDMRKAAGLTQMEVAERLHMDRSYYSRIERGERSVDVELLDAVAEMCGYRAQIVRIDRDDVTRMLDDLSAEELALMHRLARVLPALHPVRRLDL